MSAIVQTKTETVEFKSPFDGAQRLFERMKSIIEADGYPLLKSYQSDFYVHDREFLDQTFHPGAEYLLVVRTSGTYIAPLGIHPKLQEFVECGLESEQPFKVYHLSHHAVGGVREVTVEKAMELLKRQRYEVRNDAVWRCASKHRAEALIAYAYYEFTYSEKGRSVDVAFRAGPGDQNLSYDDFVALSLIAGAESMRKMQSLFCSPKSVTFEREPLASIIDAQRQAIRQAKLVDEAFVRQLTEARTPAL